MTTPYSRARLREAVCAVTESCSASPGSTSGASATSASRSCLIDLSSFAQAALTQRLNATMKTIVRITLVKLAKVKGRIISKSQKIQRAKDCAFLVWTNASLMFRQNLRKPPDFMKGVVERRRRDANHIRFAEITRYVAGLKFLK